MNRMMIFLVLACLVTANVMIARSLWAVPPGIVQTVDSLSGRVVTADGKPLAEAIVSLLSADAKDTIATTRTLEDGQYVLSANRRPGTYVLRVLCLGCVPKRMAVERRNGTWVAPPEVAMEAFVVQLTQPGERMASMGVQAAIK